MTFCCSTKRTLFSHLMARWRDLFNAEFRCAALRSDQHLFRDQCRGRGGGRQAPPRLQPRQAAGLPAGGDRAGGHAGRSAAGLRGAARQHRGLHDAADVPRQDRAAIRPRAACLGDGSRHSHRSGAGRDARQRSAGAVSGGNAEGASVAAGESTSWPSPGSRRARACRSNCWPRTANFMSTPRVSIASARNARCAGGS